MGWQEVQSRPSNLEPVISPWRAVAFAAIVASVWSSSAPAQAGVGPQLRIAAARNATGTLKVAARESITLPAKLGTKASVILILQRDSVVVTAESYEGGSAFSTTSLLPGPERTRLVLGPGSYRVTVLTSEPVVIPLLASRAQQLSVSGPPRALVSKGALARLPISATQVGPTRRGSVYTTLVLGVTTVPGVATDLRTCLTVARVCGPNDPGIAVTFLPGAAEATQIIVARLGRIAVVDSAHAGFQIIAAAALVDAQYKIIQFGY